jgi:DNA-binding MarR family transcriptional regulator
MVVEDMSISSTSLIAYRALTPNGLGKRQNTVLAFLVRRGPMSNKQIAEATGWPINTITPRVKELRDLGLVQLSTIQYDQHTNRPECVWKVVPIGGE